MAKHYHYKQQRAPAGKPHHEHMVFQQGLLDYKAPWIFLAFYGAAMVSIVLYAQQKIKNAAYFGTAN